VICRRELFIYLNQYRSPTDLQERAAAFALLVADGLLRVHNDRDHVIALIPTTAGKALMPPVLPIASS
jgi:hypothetical protein